MPSPRHSSLSLPDSDADLVAACLAGERGAFAQIVERYQRLLCSLAYAATGSVSESEDVAQETFIAAWSQLAELREPEKLRPWLCGILRHKVSRFRRQFGRDAVFGAESVEAAHDVANGETSAPDRTIHAEEQAILWRALGQVPTLYREPLVLFYRENRSIEHVAGALDLSEDTVKQRLSRGRKILQEQALAFVEGALARTTPGRAFTLGVLAALPAFLPVPAKAAGIGATVATQGSVLAKTTGLAALLASAAGVATAAMQLRVGLDQSRTNRERRATIKATIFCFFGCLAFIALLWVMRVAAIKSPDDQAWLAFTSQALVVGFIVAWPIIVIRMLAHFRRMRSEERRLHPEKFIAARDRIGSRAGNYRSRFSLFGVPLVHVRFASPEEGDKPVVGWIAGGDRAMGLLFAWGGWAVAPISVGGVAVGGLAIGAVSFGVIGLGTFGTGLLAIGGIAVGFKAFAGISALGWHAAQSNGFAVARIAAEAPVAFAEHANTPLAHQLLTDPNAQTNQMIFLIVVTLGTLVPMTLYTLAVRKRLGPTNPGP
jgi:RNA polymerase sigma factor (sigma-70 family)